VTLTTGARLGPYEVLSLLGAGGMGEVYLARDTRLGRQVAIKTLLGSTSSTGLRPSRLLQEARAAATLTHPNIAAIHDVIEIDGVPMIVMEYVPGQSLDAYLRTGRPSLDQVIAWGEQVAEALGTAHAHGIIHCDIKPGNIRLTPDGTIKVLDFGVARVRSLTAEDGAETAPVTAATTVSSPAVGGTPPYMAPEQLLSRQVDPRTDVYALGVLLFELLTGRRPFDAAGGVDLGLQILSGRVPVVTDVNPSVPRAVSSVVSRAMARQPSDRYGSAAEVAAALRVARDIASSTEREPERTTASPFASSPRWRSAIAWTAAVVFLAALGIGVRWRWFAPPTAGDALHDPIVAVLPLTNLSGESQNDSLSAGVTDVLISKVAALPGARVLSTSATAPYREGADRADRVARDLGATLIVEGSLQRAGNRLRVAANLMRAGSRDIVWSGTYDATVDDIFSLQRQLTDGLIQGLQSAGALSRALTTTDRARLGVAPTSDSDAFANYAQGRSFLERPDVPGSLDRAAGLLQSALARDPRFALAHAALGETYWAQYQNTRDTAWIAKAQEETLEALRLDPDQAGVHYSLAVIYDGTGRRPQAIEELQRAIAMQPASDDAHRLLGEIMAKTDLERGVAELRQAVTLRPSYWGNHWSLGFVLYNAGRYQDAVPSFQRVTELQPDNARGFQTLGVAYHQLGDLGNALANYKRAIAITPTSGAYSNIGTILYDRGEFTEAARAYEQSIALVPNSATLHRNAADAYDAMGEREKARAAYGKAVALVDAALKVNPRDARGLALRAFCEAKLGSNAAATEDIDRALQIAPADKEVLYKKAVVLALTGNDTGALEALSAAVAHGYSASVASRDRDWAALRLSPEFKRLVRQSP
jgi:serine/threonine protein kinase/tetratricopeptide (TPR) repeat protein